MTYYQEFYTSRKNRDDGQTRIGEEGRLWYEQTTNTIRVANGYPGGQIVGTVTANPFNQSLNTYNDVQFNNLYVTGSNITFSNTSTLNLGNLYINDETIGGLINNRDITLTPAGTGLVSVPGLKIPVGSIIGGTTSVNVVVANLELNYVDKYATSTMNNLLIGEYGLTNGISGASPGWTVYRMTTNAANVAVNDTITGTGIPYQSTVLFVGNVSGTDSANANVIITSNTLQGLPTPPISGTTIFTTRPIVDEGLAITTRADTDIQLVPGANAVTISGSSIYPFVDDVFDLGSPTKRWRHLWMGAGTIYVLDETLGTDQTIGAKDGNLYIGGGTGLTVGKFTFYGNTIALYSPSEDFYIGTQYATGNLNFNRPMQVLNSSGKPAFRVDRNGLTTLLAPVGLTNTQAVFSINGSSSGNVQPRNFSNTMIQVTGQDNAPNRISFDAFGVSGGQNSYVAIAARAARGSVDTPATTQAGDTILRFTGQGWTGNNSYAGSIVRINLEAAETFTSNVSTGTRITIQTTPVGSNTIANTASFYSNGLVLGTGTGVTFADNSRQTTAYIPSQSVFSITAATGLQQNATYGNVTLTATGVQNVSSLSTSLTVADTGGKNLTLQLAQEIGPNSNPTFGNVYVNSNLYVAGNIISQGSSAINGKKLYLANNSTTSADIQGGGIQLGANGAAYARSILYSLTGPYGDYWYTDTTTGFQAEHLVATDAYFSGNLFANGTAKFGGAYNGVDYPNTSIQVDSYVDNYSQIISQNHSPGPRATTDFIATSNNGDDLNYYIDLGITGSNYSNSNPANSLGTSVNGSDGYLYVQGNATVPAASGGNLTIGAITPSKVVKIIAGGLNASNVIATFSNTQVTVAGNVSATYYLGNGYYLTGLPTLNSVTAINANITNLWSNAAYQESEIANLNANISAANSSISSITSAWMANASYQEGEISGLRANIIAANTNISTLQSNVGAYETFANVWLSNLQNNVNTINANVAAANLAITNISSAWQANAAAQQVWIGNIWNNFVATITPSALSPTVHIAATKSGNVATIITDATTANVANTIVVRDATGTINVSGWTVGTHLTAVDYTATTSDYWIGTSAKNTTITLPNAANGASNGRQYQIADTVHSGNPGTTIAAQSPATVVGNQPSQQGQIIIATYVNGTWYCN
jgi:hypothetical protein